MNAFPVDGVGGFDWVGGGIDFFKFPRTLGAACAVLRRDFRPGVVVPGGLPVELRWQLGSTIRILVAARQFVMHNMVEWGCTTVNCSSHLCSFQVCRSGRLRGAGGVGPEGRGSPLDLSGSHLWDYHRSGSPPVCAQPRRETVLALGVPSWFGWGTTASWVGWCTLLSVLVGLAGGDLLLYAGRL